MNPRKEILIAAIFLAGCHPGNNRIQNVWISKHTIHHAGSESEIILSGTRNILAFDEDSLVIKNFYYDFIPIDLIEKPVPYGLKGETLLLKNKEDKEDTLSIQTLDDHLLTFSYSGDPDLKSVYEKLPGYHQGNRAEAFFELLTSTNFSEESRLEIFEFQKNAALIVPDLYSYIGDYQYWMIDTFKEELFLVVFGQAAFMLHIKEIKENGFSGVLYGADNKELTFYKTPTMPNFDKKNLLDTWDEDATGKAPPPPLPDLDTLSENYEKEILEISDSIIVYSRYFRKDTLKWETNRGNNLIRFLGKQVPFRKNQWKIIWLQEDELIIERLPRYKIRNGNNEEMERIKFLRKK